MTPVRMSRVLAEKRAIVLPLVVAVIANVLLYILVVFPLSRQVASAEAEAKSQHELLARARHDYESAKATVAGKQNADLALQRFYKDVLPMSQSRARTLTYTRLAQLAQQANVRLESGQSNNERVKDSTLSKLTTTYTLMGDYRNVRRFIYSLETTPEFVVLENVALTSPGETAQGRGLAVNIDIATYYRSLNVGN